MGLGTCSACIKYVMFAFNFLFWIIGCGILGIGIWLRADPNLRQYVDISENFNYLYTGAYIFIFIGVMVMLIGFLGCCGALRESQCMLATFFVCLLLIFTALLAVAIWSILSKQQLRQTVTDVLQRAVDNYHKNPEMTAFMDLVQDNLHCCGADKGVANYGLSPALIDGPCPIAYVTQPCDQKLFNFFAEHLIIIAAVGIGLGVVMVMGMTFSLLLCCAVKMVDPL